jgi:hypothetical protein
LRAGHGSYGRIALKNACLWRKRNETRLAEFTLRGGIAMWRRAGFRVGVGLICLATLAVAYAGPGSKAVSPPAGPPSAPRAHGFMLYFSRPLGGVGLAGAGGLKLSLRIEQVRMLGNSGAPDAGDPMQHRELIGFQMGAQHGLHASDMRLELGGRASYDLKHGGFAFGPESSQPRTLSPRHASAGAEPGRPMPAARFPGGERSEGCRPERLASHVCVRGK